MTDISRIKKVSVLQHDSSDCGAACLVSVIRYCGGTASIESIRKMSGTSQTGTSMLGLYQAAVQSGMEAKGYQASIEDIIGFDKILILHVILEEKYEHYVVYYGFENDRFIIWDPSKGIMYRTADELSEIWKSNKCLALHPGKGFRNIEQDKREKRQWLFNAIKPEKEHLILSVFIGIIVSALSMVLAIYTQKLIDNILPSGETTILITSSILVLLLLSARVIFSSMRQYMLLSQGREFNVRVVDDFYSSLLILPKSFFDSRKTGDLVARLNDTMRIQGVISDIAGVYVIDVLILVVTLVIILYYSFTTFLFSLGVLPLIFLLVYRRTRLIISAQFDVMASYASSESNFISSLLGITEIKSMNWLSHFKGKNMSVFSGFQERAFVLGKIKVKLGMITGLAGAFYIISLLFYAGYEVMSSRMSQGEMVAIVSLCSTLLPSVLNLALITVPLSESKVAIDRMFEFTKTTPELYEVYEDYKDPDITRVSLQDISFRFPGQRVLLSRVNIEIRRGVITALTGESGCGKSTLVNLIMRFYDMENGTIRINDIQDCTSIPLNEWRDRIALIPQEVHIFNATILENLLPEVSEKSLNDLMALITEAGMAEFFDAFPSGLFTLVGEGGLKLSGGQKQIIAFVRALSHNPDILIIDEGTSGMDRATEAIFVQLLQRIKKETGILLITHRISLVKQLCDYIYVLEGGCISAEGTHNELMQKENLYKKFWNDFL